MRKKTLSLLLVLVLLAVALAGCADSNKPAETPAPSTDPAQSSETPAEEPTPTEEPEERSLTIAVVNDPTTMDPHARDSSTELQISNHVYDALVDYNTDLSLRPALAESWDIINDGYTWQFHLRKGVKFQNGNDFTADDVVYTLDRIMSDDTLQMNVFLFRIDKVEKVDDYTVNITTKVKYPVFAGSLKSIMILDKESTEGMTSEEISDNPNGTGRYRFVEHVRESHVDMVRNEDYWGEKPQATNLRFRVISNPGTRTAALLSGDVDLISAVPVLDVESLSKEPGIEIISISGLSCNYIGINQHDDDPEGTTSPNPLKDVRVRQALYHAIDIDEIIKTIMSGQATAAVSYMPDMVNGFDDKAERYPFDPEKAKSLLAEAGYADGFPLRIDAVNDGSMNEVQVSQAIASYLEKVGIDMEVNLIPRSMFLELTNPRDMRSSFFMARWGDSSGEGVVILNDMVYTYEGKPGFGEGNKGKYSNPEVDRLLDIATEIEDIQERAEAVKEIDRMTREEAAYIPLFFGNNIFGIRDHIRYTPKANGVLSAWDVTFVE